MSTIRIANWNLDRALEHWRQTAIIAKLREINADIFVLTETRDSISPGEQYTCIASSGPRSKLALERDESWVSIWSRLQLVATHITKDHNFTASATVTLPDGSPLTVFGTVLPWRGQMWGDHPSAGAVAFKEALQLQQEDWQALSLGKGLHLCVAGDFNQDLSQTPYYWSRKAQQHLQSALLQSGLVATTSDSNDPVRHLTNGAAACIDHICFSRSIFPRQASPSKAWSPEAEGRILSDHPGVWIELTF